MKIIPKKIFSIFLALILICGLCFYPRNAHGKEKTIVVFKPQHVETGFLIRGSHLRQDIEYLKAAETDLKGKVDPRSYYTKTPEGKWVSISDPNSSENIDSSDKEKTDPYSKIYEEKIEELNEIQNRIFAKYGVQLHFDGEMPYWTQPGYVFGGNTGTPLTVDQSLASARKAEEFLSGYKPEFIRQNLSDIYFSNRILDQAGILGGYKITPSGMGGFYNNGLSPDSIQIAENSYPGTIDHEFTHLLLRKHQ